MTSGPSPVLEAPAIPEDAEERRREERAELLVRLRYERLEKLRVPLPSDAVDAVARRTLENTHALAIVRGWWNAHYADPGGTANMLVLLGRPGCGKTVAAATVLTLERPSRYSDRPTLWRAQYTKLRSLSRLFTGWGEEEQAYRRMIETDILVVDEVGTSDGNDRRAAATAECLLEVIDERQGQQLRTILISNLDRADLLARLDERTVDRLRASAVVREVKGGSLRKGVL